MQTDLCQDFAHRDVLSPLPISQQDRRVMGVVYLTYGRRKKPLGGESVESVLREGMGNR
jgi:hypothetical protein